MSTTTAIELLAHPGPPSRNRRTSVPTEVIVQRISLPAGGRLIDALDDALAQIGVASAQVEINGGAFERLEYVFPAVRDDGSTAAWYSATHHAEAPAHIIGGSITVGHREGARFTHAHLVWFDARGQLRGGHLLEETLIGPCPMDVTVHALPGVQLTSATDPESLLPVFTPSPVRAEVQSRERRRRAVMSRVMPNENIVAAAQAVAREHGFARAEVRASIGSLIGASFGQDGSPRRAEGPATEVVSLVGVVDPAMAVDDHVWSAVVVDLHGQVHAGQLVPEDAIVSITFELLLEELDEQR